MRLRTLIATNSGLSTISSDSILQLKCLRTFDLSNNSIEKLPEEMGVLIHLLYLNLSRNVDLKVLPDTLGNLCNLQTLRLAFCTKLEVGGFEKLGPASSDREESEQREMDEEILNAFEPHPNLERLLVFGYQGNTLFLKWMLSLHNLRWLEVVRLPFCKFLAPLGKLPCLEYFKIDGMKSLKKVCTKRRSLDGSARHNRESMMIKMTMASAYRIQLFSRSRLANWFRIVAAQLRGACGVSLAKSAKVKKSYGEEGTFCRKSKSVAAAALQQYFPESKTAPAAKWYTKHS
ncbi:NB-ARC domain-containing disease resistance protein [Prunus dulcis]|uniref:NB-ARC domain-containing disease resistance protein n=1 Tax=Prunus dulcis TaxID=3755 RepID=A0A4Y1QVP3_PRUDU|nr:NB-ARC domain-containing disease resistance protein [Prunus dulcis]